MKLSILICSLYARAVLLDRLVDGLTPQYVAGETEVLLDRDDGQDTVGAKRNRLLDRATGEYVCFVDDDDRVSPQYVKGILAAIERGPDCVGIWGNLNTPAGTKPMLMSQRHGSLGREPRPVTYHLRACCHLNPVRRELALAAGFPDMSNGEDCDYSAKLHRHLRREAVADPELTRYEYDFHPAESATAARPGTLYRNRFGGDYAFSMIVQAKGGPIAVSVDGTTLTHGRRYPANRRVHLRFVRHNGHTTFTTDGQPSGIAYSADRCSTVELPAGAMQLVRAGSCVVGTRDVILRYARKGV